MSNQLDNFDLSRLTRLGWLIVLLSSAVGCACAIVVGLYWEQTFGAPSPSERRQPYGIAGLAGFGAAVLVFFALKTFLQHRGVQIIRPKSAEQQAEPKGGRRRRKITDEEGCEDEYEKEDDRPRRRAVSRRHRDNDSEDEDVEGDRRRDKSAARRYDDFEDEQEREPRGPASAKAKGPTAPMPPAKPTPAAAGSSVLVKCSNCNRKLKIPATAVGKKVKCPGCGSTFVA